MARWGKRWMSLPGESGPVPGTRRVGGRYVTVAKGGKRPVYRRGAVRFKSRYELNYSYLALI